MMANGGVAGHAGLYSDAEDLAVLCQAMLNGGIYKASACIVRMSLICSPASRTASLPVVWALSAARPLWDAATVTMTHSATRASRYACRDDNRTNKTAVIFLTNKQNVGFKPNSTSYYSPYNCCGEICELVWNTFGAEAPAETLADKISAWL